MSTRWCGHRGPPLPGRREGRPSERGAAAVLVVLFLPCLLASLALALDVGALLVARAQMRAAADMGALAGVQDLDYDLLAQGLIVIRSADAVRDAREWVLANLEGRAFIEPGTVRVVVAVLNTEGAGAVSCPVTGRLLEWPTVCVKVEAMARLPFLPALGLVKVSIHADASVVGRP